MSLEEAGLPYDYIEIDPHNKTPEWLSISRGTGQVPVLEVRTGDALARIPGSVRASNMWMMSKLISNRWAKPRWNGQNSGIR
jgi:glutaredoxin